MLLFFISGCTPPRLIYYNSQSDIPLRSKSIETTMKLMKSEKRNFRIGVLVASDKKASKEKKSSYVVFAPSINGVLGYVNSIDDIKLSYTSTIDSEKLDQLIEGVEFVIKDWDNNYIDNKGNFYDFSSAPEQNIKTISTNVEEWNPSFRFNYYNYEDKKLVSIVIGPEGYKYIYYIDDLSAIKDFRALLLKAKSELTKMELK